MSGIVTCALCGWDTAHPDEHWLSVGEVAAWRRAVAPTPVVFCCARHAVLWLEGARRPTDLGVAL